MTDIAAIVLTGAPGAGKSATIQALSDLLADADVRHGAFEMEQLAWGHPWLPFADTLRLLHGMLSAQRSRGRALFLVTATTETDEQLESLVGALGNGSTLVVALRARPATVAARIMDREPEHWSGRGQLAARARGLAATIPRLSRVDVVLDTDDSTALDVARVIHDEFRRRIGGGRP